MVAVGNFLFRYRNALFPLSCALLLLPGPSLFAEPLLAAALGGAVVVLGQTIRALTIGLDYIVRGGRQGKVYAEGLVVTGVYRLTRNPMYVGNVLIAIGLAVASNSVAALLVAAPLVVFAYAAIVAAEENYLSAKFGEAYVEYCRAVPRWLPRANRLGAVLSGTTFHWRRVVVKEYGTPAGWIGVLCGITLYNLWRTGMWNERKDTVWWICVVLLVTFTAWFLVRALKKMRRLQAD
jgi:protein-S-isoprenylcysteine O-methyltransferase Ste14